MKESMSVESLKPKGMPLRKVITPEELDQQIRGVAKTYEQQFLREMVKAMRTTVGESDLINISQGEKIFREQLDQEYADQWGTQGGIGLADLIYDQIMEKFGSQMGLRAEVARPQGPIPVTEQDQFKIKSVSKSVTSETDLGLTMALERGRAGDSSGIASLVAPWRAEVLGSESLGDGLTSVQMKHDAIEVGASESSFIFQGVPNLKSQFLNPGEKFATLSPESRLVNWRLKF